MCICNTDAKAAIYFCEYQESYCFWLYVTLIYYTEKIYGSVRTWMSVLRFFMVVIWLSSTHLKPNFQRKRSQHIFFKSNFQCDISENWLLFLVLLDTSVICNTVGVVITCLLLYETYFFLPQVFNQLPCLLLFGILVGFICIFFLEIPVTGLFIVKTIMLIERFILYLDCKRSSGWSDSWEALHSPSQHCNHPGDLFSIKICYSWVHFLRESHLHI